jgi:hypothetical protein
MPIDTSDDRKRLLVNSPDTTAAGMDGALDRLTRVRDRQQALLPLRILLQDADEEARAAAIAAAEAGLSERAIAARLGVAQPTVHSWLDGRSGTPLPGPALATRTWALHHIVSATASETARLIGERLPDAPSTGHGSPHTLVRKCRTQLEDVSSWLATSAAAMDYAAADNG